MFNATQGAWIVDGVGQWTLEERATASFVGVAGALHREPRTGPNEEGDVELAWTLVRESRGRGFATEAMRAIVSHPPEREAGARDRARRSGRVLRHATSPVRAVNHSGSAEATSCAL